MSVATGAPKAQPSPKAPAKPPKSQPQKDGLAKWAASVKVIG